MRDWIFISGNKIIYKDIPENKGMKTYKNIDSGTGKGILWVIWTHFYFLCGCMDISYWVYVKIQINIWLYTLFVKLGFAIGIMFSVALNFKMG